MVVGKKLQVEQSNDKVTNHAIEYGWPMQPKVFTLSNEQKANVLVMYDNQMPMQ